MSPKIPPGYGGFLSFFVKVSLTVGCSSFISDHSAVRCRSSYKKEDAQQQSSSTRRRVASPPRGNGRRRSWRPTVRSGDPVSGCSGTYEEGGEWGPLSVDVPGRGRALAVFSFTEEAQLHLRLGTLKGHWAIEEAAPEELVRMLLGSPCGIRWVALDPIAEVADARLAAL
jgi:hypothetical protein